MFTGVNEGEGMEKSDYDIRQELTLLDPKRVRLYIDKFEDLALELEGGEIHKPVKPLRAFPVTDGDSFIVLRDAENKEIGTIQNLSRLDAESQRALSEMLERLYFTARITRINGVEEAFHIPTWDVETDRGPRVFEMGSMRRDIRPLAGGRVLIRDADGNRYEIPDYRKLDPISRSFTESII
jgi:hypothetical protein